VIKALLSEMFTEAGPPVCCHKVLLISSLTSLAIAVNIKLARCLTVVPVVIDTLGGAAFNTVFTTGLSELEEPPPQAESKILGMMTAENNDIFFINYKSHGIIIVVILWSQAEFNDSPYKDAPI